MLPQRESEQLQEDVLQELAWDVHVAPARVMVEIRNDVVILTGTVGSWAAKLAAEQAARRVHGVHHVANEIEVRPTDKQDAELAAAVRVALQWDVFVPEDLIYATVLMGTVTLRGCVDTYPQRDDTERAVRNLAGVRAVINEILVLGADVTPDSLREAIHSALERHADREAARVQIDIDGGRVTLHGRVSSWHERDAIVGAVTGTRGVESVIDHLQLL